MSYCGKIAQSMIAYYQGDNQRINHFLKVSCLARGIGILENLDSQVQDILEIAALTHDIGIKISEEKYKSAAAIYQQTEGPPEAQKMLSAAGVPQNIIRRVCWLIANHHEYDSITAVDHQILVEADFLVNADEGNLPLETIISFRDKVFRTESGKTLLNTLFIMRT